MAEAVALPPGTVLIISTVNALAQLRKLRLDQESFKEVGRDVAVMKATLGGADGATQTWMMTLIQTDDTWKLAYTFLEQ